MQRRNFVAAFTAATMSLFTLGRPRIMAAGAVEQLPVDPLPTPAESSGDDFQPIRSPKRFRVVGVEWGPYRLSQAYHDYMSDNADKKTLDDPEVKARALELLAIFRSARKAYPNPDNLLAIPGQMCGESELDRDAKKLLTREEAVETAARWNQDLLNDFDQREEEQYVGNVWFVVFEHGQTRLHHGCLGADFAFDETGWGVECRSAYTQLRLVRPTTAELARYAIASEVKA